MADRNVFTFIWHIENFNNHLRRSFRSPTFVVDALVRSDWHLSLYPGSFIGDDVTCLLWREKDGPGSITVDFDISVLPTEGAPDCIAIQRVRNKTFSKHDDSVHSLKMTFGDGMYRDVLIVRCRMWGCGGEEMAESVRLIARTRLDEDHLVAFTWPIVQLSALRQNLKKSIHLSSPRLSVLSLTLFVGHGTYRVKDIQIVASNVEWESVLSMTFRMRVLDQAGKTLHCVEDSHPVNYNHRDYRWRFPFMITSDHRTANGDCCVFDDVLTLRFESSCYGVLSNSIEDIHYGPPTPPRSNSFASDHLTVIEPSSKCLKRFRKHVARLGEDLKYLANSTSPCDSHIKAGGRTFPIHRALLSSRSSVLRSMLDEGLVQVPFEVDADTMIRLLSYLYTNTTQHLDFESAVKLYSAAVQYQMPELRQTCVVVLRSGLTDASSACEVLVLADAHRDRGLTAAAQDFIVRRKDEVVSSYEWRQLMKHNLKLAADTMLLVITMNNDYVNAA